MLVLGRELLLSMEDSHPFPHLSQGWGVSPTLGLHRWQERVSNQILWLCLAGEQHLCATAVSGAPGWIEQLTQSRAGKQQQENREYLCINVGHISRHKEKAPPVPHILGDPAEPRPVLPLGCAGARLASHWRGGRISQLQENFRGPCSHNEYT